MYKQFIRLRHYNWLRYNRVLINNQLHNRNYSYHFIKKILKKDKNTLFLNTFFLVNVKKLNIKSDLPNMYMATKQCIFGGKSKGVRWSIHRMKLLNLSYRGLAGSLTSARW